MLFQQKVAELHQYLETWSKEVRAELKLGDLPEHLLRDALEPVAALKISPTQQVKPGVYASHNRDLQVSVISQDPQTGLIVVELPEPIAPEARYQTMSPGIFSTLFVQSDLSSLRKEELLDFYKHHDASDPAVIQHHLTERAKSFSQKAIENAYVSLAEKYNVMAHHLVHADPETLKADYLEFLFLAFILGARLGFSPGRQFQSLYLGVCALVDNTIDQVMLTRKHYEEQGIETDYVKYELFDPVIDQLPPSLFYITYSTKDQMGPNGINYPKGCYLPSVTLASAGCC
jgi:hypothetical protein